MNSNKQKHMESLLKGHAVLIKEKRKHYLNFLTSAKQVSTITPDFCEMV